jgi:hypothetical protein
VDKTADLMDSKDVEKWEKNIAQIEKQDEKLQNVFKAASKILKRCTSEDLHDVFRTVDWDFLRCFNYLRTMYSNKTNSHEVCSYLVERAFSFKNQTSRAEG